MWPQVFGMWPGQQLLEVEGMKLARLEASHKHVHHLSMLPIFEFYMGLKQLFIADQAQTTLYCISLGQQPQGGSMPG